MSGDQRPARVRVFSSGDQSEQLSSDENASQPRRRRGDREGAREGGTQGDADNNAHPAGESQAAEKPRGRWVARGLFLIGCALGGALLSFSGLMGDVPQ